MNNFIKILIIIALFGSNGVFAETFDSITPANPLSPKVINNNTIAVPLKKATLTHNSVHNQYVFAFERFVQSNVKSAYNDFKILIETMNENDYAYIKMAENMAELGFFDLSKMSISKIQDKSITELMADDIKRYHYPSKKLSKDDEIYLAEIYSNIVYNDQSREATTELSKETELLARSDYANYITALGYLKSNEFIDADLYINKAIEMNPENLNYKKLKAEILSQGKNSKNAVKLVNSLKSQNLYSLDYKRKVNSLEQYVLYKSKKNYSDKMYHLGYYYYYENEPAKAIRTLQSAIDTKSKLNKDIYSILSRVYFDYNDFEKAEDNALKALKLDRGNSTALLVLGDLSYRTKDFKTALKHYKNADVNSKNSYLPQIRIAQTYEQLNDNKKAQEIYEKLIKTYNDCYMAYYKVALNDKSKEMIYLKKALAININFKDAWIDLAKIFIEQQNFDNAKKYLRVANYIDENDFRYYYYLGLITKKQGLDGKSYFQKSLTINPDFTPAQEELKL